MKRFRKIYLEISNICNLSCAFCPGTKRPRKAMTEEEFSYIIPKLQPWTDYLYFHLMGEPLCHPKLKQYLQEAGALGFKIVLTTNGTLLRRNQNTLLEAESLHKLNISLHAFEANDLNVPFSQYLMDCFDFGIAAEGKKIICYRLWNHGGAEKRNNEILTELEWYFPKPWVTEKHGIRIGNRVYLEYGDKFDWPDLSADDRGNHCFCYGLRDQIGILCDGTVVPCCLDHEGDIALGNIFTQELTEILDSPRANAIYAGFQSGNAVEELCRRCGYARRFYK